MQSNGSAETGEFEAALGPGAAKYSPQPYRLSESHRGAEEWEVRWYVCYRKTHNGRLVSSQFTLLVVKNVRTSEVKYFVSNRVPGSDGWTVRELLRLAIGRWKVEEYFREAKEELGWDHFECRGWGRIHRHFVITILIPTRLRTSAVQAMTFVDRHGCQATDT